MSSTTINNLPTNTGVLLSDNAILASSNLTYKLSVSELKNSILSKTVSSSIFAENYNLQVTDINNVVVINKAFANTITISNDINTNASIGDTVKIIRLGTNNTRVVPASGIGLWAANGTDMIRQYGVASLMKVDNNQWITEYGFAVSTTTTTSPPPPPPPGGG